MIKTALLYFLIIGIVFFGGFFIGYLTGEEDGKRE